MRRKLIAACLLAACGGAPKPAPKAPEVKSKRDFIIKLEADGGDSRVLVDNEERLLSSPNRGTTIALDFREGEHAIVVRSRPKQYGGMGLGVDLTSGKTRLLSLSCDIPCDEAKLGAWAKALQADAKRLSHPCAGADIADLSTISEKTGAFEISFKLRVAPLMTEAQRSARGCE